MLIFRYGGLIVRKRSLPESQQGSCRLPFSIYYSFKMNTIHTGNDYSSFGTYLHQVLKDHPDTIRAAVAKEALEHTDVDAFFDDLLQHGCISGMVSSLVYYQDTHNFYDKYYQEIENIRQEVEEATGHPLNIEGDLKNYLAWLSFEVTAGILLEEWNNQ